MKKRLSSLQITFIFIILEGGILFGYYLLESFNVNNTKLLHLSINRLALLASILAVVLLHIFLYLHTFRTKVVDSPLRFDHKQRKFEYTALMGIMVFWILSISDVFWPVRWVGYIYRLKPFLLYGLLVSLHYYWFVNTMKPVSATHTTEIASKIFKAGIYIAGVFLLSKPLWPVNHIGTFDHLSALFRPLLYLSLALLGMLKIMSRPGAIQAGLKSLPARVDRYTLVPFSILICTLLFIQLTGFGAARYPEIDLWNPGSVPVLLPQLVFLVFVSVDLNNRRIFQSRSGRKLIIIGLAIWVLASVLWISQPFHATRTNTEPTPPENLIIPERDAAYLDYGAQSVLIGEGIHGGRITDKPLYMLFLAGVYGLLGNDFYTATTTQILILSIVPVLLFIAGSVLVDRKLGVLLALFAIVQEVNAIAMVEELVAAHVRMLLTEPFSEMMMVLQAFVTYMYVTGRGGSRRSGAILGALFGLGSLLRFNFFALFFIILAFLIVFSVFRKSLRNDIGAYAIMFLCFALVISPFSFYSRANTGRFFFSQKISLVVSRSYWGNETLQFLQGVLERDEGGDPGGLPVSPPVQGTERNPSHPDGITQNHQKKFATVIRPYLAHFIHNEVMTLAGFPLDFGDRPIEEMGDEPIWSAASDWNGRLKPTQMVFSMANLFFLALGIGWMAKKWRLAGMVPLVYHLGYNLTNASALTSGGRYLVPAEWGLYLYYLAGVYVLVSFRAGEDKLSKNNIALDRISIPGKGTTTAVVGLALILSLLIPAVQYMIPSAYPVSSDREVLNLLTKDELDTLAKQGISIADIEHFLDQPDAQVFMGRAAYPNLEFSKSKDPPVFFTIRLIKPWIPINAKLENPDAEITHFPHLSDSIIVGCMRAPRNMNAWLIISMEEPIVLKPHGFDQMKCDSTQ